MSVQCKLLHFFVHIEGVTRELLADKASHFVDLLLCCQAVSNRRKQFLYDSANNIEYRNYPEGQVSEWIGVRNSPNFPADHATDCLEWATEEKN